MGGGAGNGLIIPAVFYLKIRKTTHSKQVIIGEIKNIFPT